MPAMDTLAPPADTRLNLIGLSREALTAALVETGEKAFRAKQVWHWMCLKKNPPPRIRSLGMRK